DRHLVGNAVRARPGRAHGADRRPHGFRGRADHVGDQARLRRQGLRLDDPRPRRRAGSHRLALLRRAGVLPHHAVLLLPLTNAADNAGVTFPVLVPVGALRLHPHTVFDVAAYAIGFRVFLWQRRRLGDTIDAHARWTVVAAAILGAAIGSKVFYWLEDPAETLAHWKDPAVPLGGKTSAGGLSGGLGGGGGQERWAGVRRRGRGCVRGAGGGGDRDGRDRVLPVGSPGSHVRHALVPAVGSGFRRRHPAAPDAALRVGRHGRRRRGARPAHLAAASRRG